MSRNTDNRRKEELAEELLAGAGAEPDSQARPGFREASFYRIQKRLAEEGMAGHHGERREERRDLALPHRARWAVLIPTATLLMMMLFTTGAFAFSLNADPDSSLYGTKLFFEGSRLALTGSTEARVDYEMELVEKRLEELESMVSRGSQRGGRHWEDAYQTNVNRLYEEIMKLPEQQREEVLVYASAVLEKQAETMTLLQAEAPRDLAPRIEGARSCGMGAMQGMRGQCSQQCGEQLDNGSREDAGSGTGSGNGSGTGSDTGGEKGNGNGNGNH